MHLPRVQVQPPTLRCMKPNITTAWALQRPTGELVPAFIRRTRAEVIGSIAAHLASNQSVALQWQRMRRNGFSVIRVSVQKLN